MTQIKMNLQCEQLLHRYPQAWQQATVHPFLQQCQLGTLESEKFNTWLVQDYLFVLEFTRFAARTLAIAPTEHFHVLLGGLSALKDELNWFQDKARERQLDLNVPRQATCQAYCDYLQSLSQQPYPVLATALWAIELAYNQAWQLPGQMPVPYAEFAERWGNLDFTAYVKLLEKQADTALQNSDRETEKQAEAAFVRIASLEKEFWQMAYQTK